MSSNSIITSEPPASVTNSALDLFSSGHVLVNFQRGYDERVFPPTNADAPVLEFEVTGSKTDVSGNVIETRIFGLGAADGWDRDNIVGIRERRRQQNGKT